MPADFPTGVVTLVFTDIEGYTELCERMNFRPVLDRHNDLIRQIIQRWDGYEVKTMGDSFMVAFQRATDAVECAIDIQRTLSAEQWQPEVGELRVRIGIHTGEPFIGYDAASRPDYFGPIVNRASRIMNAGHGGQILLSGATRDILLGALATDIELIDRGHHQLRGLGQSEHIFEARHPDLPPRHFPPLRTIVPSNLPVHLTTFVGRKKERAELTELLMNPQTRLLTVTGPGGSGKTRLAHRVASDGADGFADGVWLVNFAEVTEPENVVPQIAAAVQLTLLPNRDPREQLLGFLKGRALLLMLDDFDRIIGATLLIADILKSAPRVKCLVTSRIALRLRGEQVYILQPMKTPDEDAVTPERLAQFDSAALFVERARAARADFEVTPHNVPHIAEVCRRLDGIPLAIELAAAQVADMSVVEVLDGLRLRLDALWSESPDVPEQHRTLRATMDRSYDLLSSSEQTALQQLSVFAGGCFRDSAQAVCGTEGLLSLRVLHRHSLVNTTELPDGRTRYSLLNMVREYARAKLDEQPEFAHEVSLRHAEFFLDFAEQRVAQMRTRHEAQALDELGMEADNLRAALQFVVSHVTQWSGVESAQRSGVQTALHSVACLTTNVEAEWCARLALALYQLLYRRGFWAEAQQYLEEVRSNDFSRSSIEATETDALASAATTVRAALSHYLASLALDMGNLAEVRRQAESSLVLRRELNDQTGVAESLNLLGLLALEEDDKDAAQQHFQDALNLLAPDDHARRGIVLHNLARLAYHRNDLDEAQRLYGESLTHRRAAGDVRGEAETLGDLGAVAHEAKDYAEASRLYHESLTLYRALRYPYGIAVTLNNLGELAELNGDLQTAIALFIHAQRLLHDLHSVDERIPAEHLQRLAEQTGAERFADLRRAAEQRTWEEMV